MAVKGLAACIEQSGRLSTLCSGDMCIYTSIRLANKPTICVPVHSPLPCASSCPSKDEHGVSTPSFFLCAVPETANSSSCRPSNRHSDGCTQGYPSMCSSDCTKRQRTNPS